MTRGDFIAGQFRAPEGEALRSVNPAKDGATVCETAWSETRVATACEAAAEAQEAWARLSTDERWDVLTRFRDALADSKGAIADALVAEVGKIRSEAAAEAGALVSRFGLVRSLYQRSYGDGMLGEPARALRYAALGVVGVVGPYNYPLHLCHGHVVPALLAGNSVVIKPSEVALLSAQRYAEAAHAAELPPGLLNVVIGKGAAGAALVRDPRTAGVCFTGSYDIGRRITEVGLSRPELLIALEMGGKNTAVVLADADLRQAAHEVVVGAMLTAGQRCTATDRVLVAKEVAEPFTELVVQLCRAVHFGDPDAASSFAGPLTTDAGRHKVQAALLRAKEAGAEALLPSEALPGGFFLSPSVHRLPEGVAEIAGYTDVELFGPDVAIQTISGVDEAIQVIKRSEFGLANSVFTASDAAFEKFFTATRAGIVNRNRSTNQASPLLPFGGVGKSGNYRPAGAHAPNNVTIPVAVQTRVLGEIDVHPHLAGRLPPRDLNGLELAHRSEEVAEAERCLLDQPRPMRIDLPSGGNLPESTELLDRLYAGGRVVQEKKPMVFDHLRSFGPWFVSVEGACLLDGMSQTATLCGGFAEDAVERGYFEGAFAGTLAQTHDPSISPSPPAEDFADVLRGQVAGLPEVTFANSGAEANEKALALCRVHCKREKATRILAFEGSFHGRTLWSLSATYNPKKREPFEIAGHQATFLPFPVWWEPNGEEPRAPAGFYAAAAAGDVDSLIDRFGDVDEHGVLAAEVHSLSAAGEALASGEYFACIVEPMQSEGGDRYATSRFFRALRLLTRYYNTDLIFDEVQTGFGLGGPFAWHTLFRLVNQRGQPDYPDAVTFAKRAQVGVCMSRHSDPEPTSSHPASLVRGRLHAEMMSMSHAAERVEQLVWPRLEALAQAYPHLVTRPRAAGYAFAFELPDGEVRANYLGQRFWRGAIVYGAGARTVRYRLSESYQTREVELLFSTIRRSLSWLDAHPGTKPPAWDDAGHAEVHRVFGIDAAWGVRVVDLEEAPSLLPTILDIEYRIYEPARRTPPKQFSPALENPDSVITVAEIAETGDVIGFAVGAPLELVADMEEGPDRDPLLGADNTLYSLSVTVAPEFQGRGVGRALKEAQLREANQRKRDDGSPRYRHVTGRNRVGHTAPMRHLNRVFGAHLISILTGQYADPEGQAVYYRIPLTPLAPPPGDTSEDNVIDAADGISRPLKNSTPALRAAEETGLLRGPAVNKLTIMNFVTPAVVRALEWVSALAPRLSRLYLTSCRDELTDKSLRLLRCHRSAAQVAIGLEGGYAGHTTAASRSISDPVVHRQGPAVFQWPRVPHPTSAGIEQTLAALDRCVAEAGGTERVFGLFVEAIQERTGAVLSDAAAAALHEWSEGSGVPIVCLETATASYRSGAGPFACSSLPLKPDILAWWGGGQTGYMHVAPRYRVDTPLTLVSTWDGDELCLVREHFQLRHARSLDLAPAIAAAEDAAHALAQCGMETVGKGMYWVIHAGQRSAQLCQVAKAEGLLLRPLPAGRVAFVPPLDAALEAAKRLSEVAGKVGK